MKIFWFNGFVHPHDLNNINGVIHFFLMLFHMISHMFLCCFHSSHVFPKFTLSILSTYIVPMCPLCCSQQLHMILSHILQGQRIIV